MRNIHALLGFMAFSAINNGGMPLMSTPAEQRIRTPKRKPKMNDHQKKKKAKARKKRKNK